MYTFNSRIRYSETDHNGKLKLSSLVDYFQDASTFHSKEVDLGIEKELDNNRAWVITYWHIEVERYAELYEDIITGTFPTKFKGFLGHRNFFMKDSCGNMIAKASSIWAYMDTKRKRPARIPEEEVEKYKGENLFEIEDKGRKVQRGVKPVAKESFTVRREYIDRNEHVNNCRYIEMAEEYIPKDKIVKGLCVEYSSQALYKDTIYPYVSEEDDRIVVELCNKEKDPYAVIEFKF